MEEVTCALSGVKKPVIVVNIKRISREVLVDSGSKGI